MHRLKELVVPDSRKNYVKKTNFSSHSVQAQNSREEDGDSSALALQALRNPIILHQILRYLPTDFLLSSCSLLNKAWNRQTGIFIWSHRHCPVKHPSTNPCQLLQDLAELCCQMRENSRVIPFNYLCMQPSGDFPKLVCRAGLKQSRLPAEMKLKILYIDSLGYSDCMVHKPLQNMVHHNASNVQRMTVDGSVLVESVLDERPPHFSRLEEVKVLPKGCWDAEVQKQIFARLFELAPKLKGVSLRHDALRLIPEEMYGLLRTLCIHWPRRKGSEQEVEMFKKITETKPELKKLSVYKPTRFDKCLTAFEDLLTSLLRTSRQGLEAVTTNCLPFLSILLTSPLINLVRLNAGTEEGRRIDEFWGILSTANIQQLAPKLCEVQIDLRYLDFTDGLGQWPKNHAIYECRNVRKLTVSVEHVDLDATALKCVFPNVCWLKLDIDQAKSLPCQALWELWPQLEHIEVCGEGNTLTHNYDAEFCGIHDEEAELLRKMDNKYLRRVHIVPIRPSVVTMRDLHTLWIHLNFWSSEQNTTAAPPAAYISKVADLVALKRMPEEDVSVIWNVEMLEGDPSGSDDEDDSSAGSSVDSESD